MNNLKKGQKLKHKKKTVLIVKKDNFREKRKEVLDIIYELKKHVDLPRIEVKIADLVHDSKTVGLGYFNHYTIVISSSLSGIELYQTVLHEIVHTVFKIKEHDEECILMASTLKTGHSKEAFLKAFLKYSKMNNDSANYDCCKIMVDKVSVSKQLL